MADAAPQIPLLLAGQDHPMPPYTPEDDVASGLKCYFPDCAYKGCTYGKIFQHVRSTHSVNQNDMCERCV